MFKSCCRGLRALKSKQCVLDGETVALDDKGRPSFQTLQDAFRGGSGGGCYSYAFDLLNLDGRDLTQLPIERRKELLESVLGNALARVRLSSTLEGEPATLLAAIQ